MTEIAVHGGGIDGACAQYGGVRDEWLDLSTGINPCAFPLPVLEEALWRQLPDKGAFEDAISAARDFWGVPKEAAILPVHGLSCVIARLPWILSERGEAEREVYIRAPAYGEYRQSFSEAGWAITESKKASLHIYIHPNNPDGRLASLRVSAPPCAHFSVIDESFCDLTPERSFVQHTSRDGVLILKSFGKFWGLAGLRLGFVIGQKTLIADLAKVMGPWQVSGLALKIASHALRAPAWAEETRTRLRKDAKRLDALICSKIRPEIYGTSLFRLYQTKRARHLHETLCGEKILTRIFPYRDDWVRIGLAGRESDWERLKSALDKL